MLWLQAYVTLQDMSGIGTFNGMRLIGIKYPPGTKLGKYSHNPLLQISVVLYVYARARACFAFMLRPVF